MTEKEYIVNDIRRMNEVIERTKAGLSVLTTLNPNLLYSDNLRERYLKTLQGLDDLISMRDRLENILFIMYRTVVIDDRELD